MAEPRSDQQRKSLELFCRLLAEELNAQGITQGVFVSALEIDNSQESVKNAFREMGFKKYLANSTTKLLTTEMQSIYEEVMRVVAFHPEWKVKHIEWPSEESLEFKNEYETISQKTIKRPDKS